MTVSEKESRISGKSLPSSSSYEEKELMELARAARQAAGEAKARAAKLDKEETRKLVNRMLKEALYS